MATGQDTDPAACTPLDLHDNMIAEVERLATIAGLLEAADLHEADARVLPGVGQLLRDIHARMRALLDLGVPQPTRRRR
jgi:hypothetical protein